MRLTASSIFAIALTVVPSFPASGGSSTVKRVEIRKLMTPTQFNQAGLAKLTPAELHALEDWLGIYTEAVAQVLLSNDRKLKAPQTAARTTSSQQVIETCIEDEFEGWEGDTIFKLCNGQIWQQSEYAYMYHYAYRPDVLIYRTSSGYRMKVEDVSETIAVERIK